MDPILVITNFPDKTTALELAEELINKKLAACVIYKLNVPQSIDGKIK